jgi:hypothetical protein
MTVVNNHHAENQSIVLEASSAIAKWTFSICQTLVLRRALILVLRWRDLGKGVRKDKFRFVDVASGTNRMVGGRGMKCRFNLGIGNKVWPMSQT